MGLQTLVVVSIKVNTLLGILTFTTTSWLLFWWVLSEFGFLRKEYLQMYCG